MPKKEIEQLPAIKDVKNQMKQLVDVEFEYL